MTNILLHGLLLVDIAEKLLHWRRQRTRDVFEEFLWSGEKGIAMELVKVGLNRKT